MIEIMKQAALAAAQVQMKYFRQNDLGISQKTDHQNIITIADKESQDVIQKSLIDGLVKRGIDSDDIGFIGEEDLHADGSHVFVIDPIDGTSNFASRIDYFCSSIAYFKDGTLSAGVIYRPVQDEMFYAEVGKSAHLAQAGKIQELKIRSKPQSELILTFNIGNTLIHDSHTKIVEKLLPIYRKGRSLGAVALDYAHLAWGQIGTTVDCGPYIWDISAGKIIVEEAGGVMFDFKGHDVIPDLSDIHRNYEIVACHPDHKEAILQIIG